MDKLSKAFRKNIVENYYRLLSVANLTVNKVARPTAEKISSYIQKRVKMQDEANDSKNELTDIIKTNIKEGVLYGDKLARMPLDSLGEYLDQSVLEVEKRLKEEYDINTNQWMFSLENLEMLEKIYTLTNTAFKEVEHISRFNSIRYITAWSMLQNLYLTSYQKKMAGKTKLEIRDQKRIKELTRIRKECLEYSLYAHGTYGKLLNQVFNEKSDLVQLMKITDHNEDFIFHTKLTESDILHSFWETTPYKPAHVIAKHKAEKRILLCMRGTHHWADAVTDLDAHYLSFSIVRDPQNEKLFLKFHFDEETQDYLRKKLGDDTRELNGESYKLLTGKEEVLETGYAHAGMLVSAIGAYKEITPKLEEIFSQPEHTDYNLVITGHSLGGGMSTLMVLLYMVHPLKAFKDQTYGKLRGYSYGGASVLSTDFDKFMTELMTTIVLGYDIVPRLSYGSVKDICNILLAFDEINKTDPDTFSRVLNMDISLEDYEKAEKESKISVKKFKDLYKEFKHNHMDSLKLFPMGKVYHIEDYKAKPIVRGAESFDFVFRQVTEKEFFDEIIFSRQMVKHHFPSLYEESLSSTKVLYQNYLHKAVNKEGSSISSPKEVKSYTK